MSAILQLTGVGNDTVVPKHYLELRFGQGNLGSPTGGRKIMVAAPLLSTGTAVANTLYEISPTNPIKTLAGPRSPATRAVDRILAVNPNAPIYYLALPETTGGSPAQADCDVTFATAPTGTGVARVYIGTVELSYTFTSSDTVTTIAAGIVAAAGSVESLPVTAANVAGVVTFTAALKGKSQGDGTSGAHRVRATITAGVGTTVSVEAAALGLSPATAGADGTTTAAAQLATALATVANLDHYYLVINEWDATSLTNLRTHIAANALPTAGRLSRGFAGFCGTVAAAAALAVAKNHERLELINQPNSDEEPIVLAANLAAVAQLYEPTRNNFSGFREAQWLVPGPASAADRPTDANATTAILGGVTLVGSNAAGSFIVKRCTTASKDSGGTVNDSRKREPHRVSAGDFFGTAVRDRIAAKFNGWDFENDEFLEDGVTVNPNQEYKPNRVKPSMIKRLILSMIDEFSYLFKNIPAMKASLSVTAHPSMNGVAQVSMALDVVDIFDQSRTLMQEVGGR